MNPSKGISLQSVKDFITSWNNSYPIDLWWRKKYNVSFNSEQHRKLNLIDAFIEYQEEKVISEYMKKLEEDKKNVEEYKMTGNFLKESEMSQEEVDRVFNELDLNFYNKKKE